MDDTMSSGKPQRQLLVLAQANCYHGDTLGAMHVAEPSVFNQTQHPWYQAFVVSLLDFMLFLLLRKSALWSML
jgi:adenosylmethionine-8-amino-7-oxononanoate aminotransferase